MSVAEGLVCVAVAVGVLQRLQKEAHEPVLANANKNAARMAGISLGAAFPESSMEATVFSLVSLVDTLVECHTVCPTWRPFFVLREGIDVSRQSPSTQIRTKIVDKKDFPYSLQSQRQSPFSST